MRNFDYTKVLKYINQILDTYFLVEYEKVTRSEIEISIIDLHIRQNLAF